MNIKPCPCGQIPERIVAIPGHTSKYALAVGSCCGEWQIEFRTRYLELGSAACNALALEAWNEAPRSSDNSARSSTRCPKCGAMIFDPFGNGMAVHDVNACRGFMAQR